MRMRIACLTLDDRSSFSNSTWCVTREHILACLTCLTWLDGIWRWKRTDWFIWMRYEVMLLLSKCCCMQVSQQASDFDSLHCYHCLCSVNLMKRFEWCFSFDFLLLTFISFLSWFDLTWLLCIIYCILSKLSRYLIEFTSKLYFTSTWAPLSSIENKDTYYHYHTGMKSNIQLKVQERTEKVASGYDQRAVDISRAVRR